MRIEVAEHPGRAGTLTPTELAEVCGLTVAELDELVDYGMLVPASASPPAFGAGCIETLRHAARLRAQFDLDVFTMALMIPLLERIESLEREVRTLQAHLPPHATPVAREGPSGWRETHG